MSNCSTKVINIHTGPSMSSTEHFNIWSSTNLT